jgi:predicted MPP superfamily phosphohydrolase
MARMSVGSKEIRYIAALAVLALIAFAFLVEPFNLSITETHIDFFDEPGEAVKVVFITDTQDAYNHPDFFSGAIQKANLLDADLILLGGDITELGDDYHMIDGLGKLSAKHGAYAVLGNHDYYCRKQCRCEDSVEGKLEDMNITVLRNENEVLEIKGRTIAIIGLDEYWEMRHNYSAASSGIKSSMDKIVLVHNQLAVNPEDVEGNKIILSGHTHCGLIGIPFVTDFLFDSAQASKTLGGYDEERNLYVSCGLTPGGVRLFTRPEISVISLE